MGSNPAKRAILPDIVHRLPRSYHEYGPGHRAIANHERQAAWRALPIRFQEAIRNFLLDHEISNRSRGTIQGLLIVEETG